MNYPTMDEVETATVEQLAEWYRFLRSPGMSACEMDPPPMLVEFNRILDSEKRVLDRIVERFMALGGMTPEVSRKIGWKKK